MNNNVTPLPGGDFAVSADPAVDGARIHNNTALPVWGDPDSVGLIGIDPAKPGDDRTAFLIGGVAILAEPSFQPAPRPGEAVVDIHAAHPQRHGRRYYAQLEGTAGAIAVIASTTPRVAGGALSAQSVQERRAKQAAKLSRRAAAAKGKDHG